MKKILTVIITLIIILSNTALAEEFTFRNTIKWGMSTKEVTAFEGIEVLYDALDENGDYIEYEKEVPTIEEYMRDDRKHICIYVPQVKLASTLSSINYFFIDDSLYYIICDSDFGDAEFADIQKYLSGNYGESYNNAKNYNKGSVPSELSDAISKLQWKSVITSDKLYSLFLWKLEDETYIGHKIDRLTHTTYFSSYPLFAKFNNIK